HKTVEALYPEKVDFHSSILLLTLKVVKIQLVSLLNTITRLLMRMVGISSEGAISGALSKVELRTIVYESRSLMSRRILDMLLSVLYLEKVNVD
ncbi:magnesium/cobalt efflux protein, partial [Erwinia amylovora]|nr:magnesium/cobalt efflux protein [Erwinia amylovora]